MTNTPSRKSRSALEQLSSSYYGLHECFFDIYVLDNPTGFVSNSSILKDTLVHVKDTLLASLE